ncbi:hypothetical protein AgCh_026434 [Apium graveolens]
MCLSFVELVINGARRCFGLENVHSGAVAPAGTSDDAKPLIHEHDEEEEGQSVSVSEEISHAATDYYLPVIADQETPSIVTQQDNDSPVPPVVAAVSAAPPPRLQTVSKGSGPQTN